MVVYEDHTGRTLGDGGAKDFTGMDQGRVQGPAGDEHLPDDAVTAVQ